MKASTFISEGGPPRRIKQGEAENGCLICIRSGFETQSFNLIPKFHISIKLQDCTLAH